MVAQRIASRMTRRMADPFLGFDLASENGSGAPSFGSAQGRLSRHALIRGLDAYLDSGQELPVWRYREKGFSDAAEGRVQGSFDCALPSLREDKAPLRMTEFFWAGLAFLAGRARLAPNFGANLRLRSGQALSFPARVGGDAACAI